MKKIIVFAVLIVGCMSAKAQFPTTDSLRAFINRYIRNSAVEAFQNLRLNTALIGMTNYLDSAYGGQVVSFTAANDSTARLITLGGDTFDVVIRGNPPSITLNNIGTGYALVATPGGDIKKLNNNYGILIDSTTTANTITIRADTSSTNHVVTQSDLNDAIAGAGSGISGLTAGRVTLSTSATTVGDDAGLTYDGTGNELTTDSTSVIQSRASYVTLNMVKRVDSLSGFGNSIMNGGNATSFGLSFQALCASYIQAAVHNRAIPGTGIYSACARHLDFIDPMHNGVTMIMAGFNSLRNNNILNGLSGRKTQNSIIEGFNATFANHFLKSYVGASDASITRTGSWFTNWDARAATGKSQFGAFTTSTGAKLSYPFTDSTIVIFFTGQNDAVQAGSDWTAKIDGVLTRSGTTSNKADGIDDGFGDGGNHISVAVVITGLSYGAHTLEIENTGSGVLIVDCVGHLRDAETSPALIQYNIPYMKGLGYVGGQSSVTRTDTMNVRLDSLYATYPAAYKARTFMLPTNTFYDTTTGCDTDDIHLNNTGHLQVFTGTIPALQGGNYPVGSIFNTPQGLYHKGETVTNKIVLGEGTVNFVPRWNTTLTNGIIQDDSTNVGIGQVPGTYRLSINGTLRSTQDAFFATSSGNVGIGTTSPTDKLDVNGNANFQGQVTSRGSSAGFAFESRGSGSYAYVFSGANDAASILTVPGSYNRIKFWNRGGMTIGHATETNPSDLGATLDVHGSLRLEKDSVPQVGSATSETVMLLDTVTNKVKRISASALGGGLSGSGTSGRIAYWNGASSLTSNANFLFNGSVFSIGTTNTQGQLNIGGNKDLTNSGAQQYNAAATYTDQITAASGTASSYSINLFAAPTIAAANSSVTFPTITNLFVDAPAAGTNATITNKYAIQTGTNGHVRVQGKLYLTDRDSSATPANVAWIDPVTEQLKVGPYQRTLKGTTNWTPGIVSAGSSTTTNITVTGATLGDPVTISKASGSYSNGEVYDAFVSATNTVTIRVHNVSTGSANYSSAADYNVIVIKY